MQIHVTTDRLIYFYRIDRKTLRPILDNVMLNYMSCTQAILGSRSRSCVTYKSNEKIISVHRRKYAHDFKVKINGKDFQGSIGLEVASMNCFLVSYTDHILIYDLDTFQQVDKIKIALLETKTSERERNEIIGMTLSKCENFLAVITGKNLIMNKQQQSQLFIFKRVDTG